MQDCQVCGRSFDPLGFQVVVPELGRGFDRIECAHSARALASPGSRVAATPLSMIERSDATLVPAAAGPLLALRLLGTPAATLGLLAAGTAAAVLLWLRVLGADPSSFTLGRLIAPPAFGHETVQAQVEAAPVRTGPVERKAPERVAPVTVVKFVAAPSQPASAPAPDAQKPQPSSPPISARPATSPPPVSGPAKVTGKGHPKRGKGHSKHGETDGAHSPGHGKAKGQGKKH
jgi:hypothetical protein